MFGRAIELWVRPVGPISLNNIFIKNRFCMVQPRYSPEEALERVKLMMKYDSSRTLNENKEVIFEQTDTQRAAIGGTAAGAATGAVAAKAALGTMGASTVAATSVGEFLLGVGAANATLVGGAVIGGLAGLALIPLVYWAITKDSGSNKVKKFFQMCSTEGAKIAKLTRKIDDKTIIDMSDNINDAVNYNTLGFLAGTDEEKLFAQFKAIQDGTVSDFCALVNQYNKNYGDLWDDLDSDIDSEDEWNQIFRPLRNCVEDSMLEVAKETEKDCKANPDQEKCKKVVEASYKDCKDFYQKGCKSPVIAKVQGCLGGLKSDGLFGPKTETKLKEKFADLAGGFRDSEVDKICKPTDEFTTKVDADKVDDILNM